MKKSLDQSGAKSNGKDKHNPALEHSYPDNNSKFNPFRPQSRPFLRWMYSTVHINFLVLFILTAGKDDSRKEPTKPKETLFNNIFRKAYGFDGLNPTTDEVLAANGELRKTVKFPFIFLLTSFFGLPNRPAGFDQEGNPILTWSQFFSNIVGGWTLSTKTWTLIEIFELPFKFLLVLPINILRIFVKTPVNIVKILTEFLLTLFNGLFALFVTIPVTLFLDFLVSGFNLYAKLIFGVILAAISLSLILVQYATLWVVRVGLLLTSPQKSAHYGFALGRSLKLDWFGDKAEWYFSYAAGILGVLVSVTLTAIAWSILFPIIMSAVTTFIPGIIPAFLWLSHLPWISASIAWASQLSIVTTVLAASGSVFAPIGGFLSTILATPVLWLAGIFGIQVTAMPMLVGITAGFFCAFIITFGSTVADVFSAFWITLHINLHSNQGGQSDDGLGVPLLNKPKDDKLNINPPTNVNYFGSKSSVAAKKNDHTGSIPPVSLAASKAVKDSQEDLCTAEQRRFVAAARLKKIGGDLTVVSAIQGSSNVVKDGMEARGFSKD